VIGGIAAVLQGSPIITQDLDICYARDDENLRTLATALRELGAKLRGVREDVPFKLDQRRLKAGDAFTFTTSLGDLDCRGLPAGTNGYDEIVANCRELEIDGVTVFVADLDDLIRMKRAAGRPKDRAMIEDLGALREEIQRREGRRRR
jgi:hypothetical protein